jgi:hypothetical protein
MTSVFNTAWIVVVAGVAATACAPAPEPAYPLEGEWKVVLATDNVPGAGADPARVEGRLLFHPELRPILHGPPNPPTGALFGRAYIEFGSFDDATQVGESVPEQSAARRELGEEVYALVDHDSVYIEIAPLIIGFDPVLRGTLSDKRVTGIWALVSHSDTIRTGRFEMIRQASSALTDSVLNQSRNR